MDCNDHLYIYDGAHATGNFRVSWSSIWLVRKKQVECTSKLIKTKILCVMSISSQLQKRNKTKRPPPLPPFTQLNSGLLQPIFHFTPMFLSPQLHILSSKPNAAEKLFNWVCHIWKLCCQNNQQTCLTQKCEEFWRFTKTSGDPEMVNVSNLGPFNFA